VRWVRSDLGTAALTREVAALRCGLDATAWDGDGRHNCTKTLGIGLAKPLPFDHARAHRLYTALFGELQDLIKGKRLLIVSSGPLTQLPFQVLVTSPPTSNDHRAAAWLAREHAITVLPAVSSLKALRRIGRPSAAPRPMIGFGNPLLDGPDARFASLAKRAQAKQRCPDRHPQRLAARNDHRAGLLRVETRGDLANVSDIKRQVPLPETADELCAVAQDVRAEAARDILLGAKATEREVKRFSASGELAKYRMVHFATHGVLAGTLDGANEPGLILTPPGKASEEDDGYLSASEIASLKLDADLVILSACNTAAGAATTAEALSGLARAFIYAQARALLVSHWEVYSDATVKLITGTVREMVRDPKVGRSEALRRSMLALIDNGAPHEAHPAYWAPFMVVGEGAAPATR
jgi:CHAT domain-containing protein